MSRAHRTGRGFTRLLPLILSSAVVLAALVAPLASVVLAGDFDSVDPASQARKASQADDSRTSSLVQAREGEARREDSQDERPARKTKRRARRRNQPAGPVRVAQIRMTGPVLKRPPDFNFMGGSGTYMTLKDWLKRLAKARNDKDVHAVVLEVDSLVVDWAQAQELADAVRRLDKVKPVYTHIVAGGAGQYLIASAGREVHMEPAGELWTIGVGVEMAFFRGTLDKLGITPQMIQIGKYKGASEPVERTGPSKELQGEYKKIIDDLYEQMVEQIANQRKLKVFAVTHAIDEAPLGAKAALEAKFVDRLTHRADFRQTIEKRLDRRKRKTEWVSEYGKKQPPKMDLSNPFAVFSMMLKKPSTELKEPTIAIVHAEGMIITGESGQSFFGQRYVGDKTIVEVFDRCRTEDNIKAVILRISSPGGSALASEMMYQAIRRCAEKKPVIVSVSNMAASGGYYIACAGDRIIADPAALVGSIGVVSGKLAVEGLMDKIGVSTFTMKRGRNANLFSSRKWNERELKVMRRHAQRWYNTFTDRVKEGRKGKIESIEEVAQGRIFTGRLGVNNGLVDQVGGLQDAVAAAQKAAKLESSYFEVLPRPKTMYDLLAGGPSASALEMDISTRAAAKLARKVEGLAYLLGLADVMQQERVLMALPYAVTISH